MASQEREDDSQIRIASYPTELDQVYERLLQKSDPRFKPELMVLLYLIDEFGRSSPVQLNNLRASIQALAKQGTLDTYPQHYLSLQDFNERLRSRLGALIDIMGGKYVRLLHKTLHTSLRVSVNWPRSLPPRFQSTYPDEVWLRLTCRILAKSTLCQRLCLERFVQSAYPLMKNYQEASVSSGWRRIRKPTEEA